MHVGRGANNREGTAFTLIELGPRGHHSPLLQFGDIARVCDNMNCFNRHRSFAHRSTGPAAGDASGNKVSFRQHRVNTGRQITSEETERNGIQPLEDKAIVFRARTRCVD